MHTGRGQLFYINHLKCTLYFHCFTLQCYSETLQSHYILRRLLILLNVYFLSPEWRPVSCWCHAARHSALPTEDRNICQCRTEKAKSALVPQMKGGKKSQIQFWLHRYPHTVAGLKKGVSCINSEKRPRTSGFGLCSEKQTEANVQEMAPQVHISVCQLCGSCCMCRGGAGGGTGREKKPSSPPQFFIAFLYSASPTCDKYFQIAYFILLLLSMQSLRMQIWGM